MSTTISGETWKLLVPLQRQKNMNRKWNILKENKSFCLMSWFDAKKGSVDSSKCKNGMVLRLKI